MKISNPKKQVTFEQVFKVQDTNSIQQKVILSFNLHLINIKIQNDSYNINLNQYNKRQSRDMIWIYMKYIILRINLNNQLKRKNILFDRKKRDRMKQKQRQLLQNIQQNYNNELFLHQSQIPNHGLYVSQTNTQQQLFLQKLINIYVLRKKQYNKIDQQRIQKIMRQNSGSFTDQLLRLRYMSYCMENKIEVSYDKFGMLKLLTNWMDTFQKIKATDKVSLTNSVFAATHPENHTISSVEELIVYVNYIATDLETIFQRKAPSLQKNNGNQSSSQIQTNPPKIDYTYDHLDVDDMLMFLNNIVPKTLFNIVIPEHFISGRPMTTMNPAQEKQKDFLFSCKSMQYFAKQKHHYQHLLKLLTYTLLKFDLSQSQQKIFMLIGFKYFYLYNRQKMQEPFSIFTKIYEKMTDAVRFALSDEFILFFKIIKKLGHTKFLRFLRQKYEWIQDLLNKIDQLAIVGHPKDNLNAFHSLSVMQHIQVAPGSMVYRCFQILQPYSLFYFYVGIKNLDINIRLYYMGTFTSPIQKKNLLINKQKSQIQFKGNIIAIQKGIYMLQFDNSYSWMKGKSLLYDTIILTPIQITKNQVEKDKFLPVLFNKFDMNNCSENNMVDVSSLLGLQHNVGSTMQSEVNNQGQQNQILIANQNQKPNVNVKFDSQSKTYNLKEVTNNGVYEYQTQNQNLFHNKVKQLFQNSSQSPSDWFINGIQKLQSLQMLRNWFQDPSSFQVSKNQPKQQDNSSAQVKNQGNIEQGKDLFARVKIQADSVQQEEVKKTQNKDKNDQAAQPSNNIKSQDNQKTRQNNASQPYPRLISNQQPQLGHVQIQDEKGKTQQGEKLVENVLKILSLQSAQEQTPVLQTLTQAVVLQVSSLDNNILPQIQKIPTQNQVLPIQNVGIVSDNEKIQHFQQPKQINQINERKEQSSHQDQQEEI